VEWDSAGVVAAEVVVGMIEEGIEQEDIDIAGEDIVAAVMGFGRTMVAVAHSLLLLAGCRREAGRRGFAGLRLPCLGACDVAYVCCLDSDGDD